MQNCHLFHGNASETKNNNGGFIRRLLFGAIKKGISVHILGPSLAPSHTLTHLHPHPLYCKKYASTLGNTMCVNFANSTPPVTTGKLMIYTGV